ncbi:MAG: hypothetical protein E7340_01065 [Clostridiales bacterium]|nr:hypothetical protein [Clostridiales bacterium]
MLNRVESKVMLALFSECKDKSAILISPTDLVKLIDGKVTESGVEKIMQDLSSDGYFDLIYSDRRGETVYCVTLLEKGKGYLRNLKVMKRTLVFRLCVTIVLAFVSFIIGLILKAIF